MYQKSESRIYFCIVTEQKHEHVEMKPQPQDGISDAELQEQTVTV